MVESTNAVLPKKPMLERSTFKHQLSPTLPVSPDSYIVIDLADPGRSYRAGETIHGVMKIVIDGYFNASGVTLRLYGVEQASF
jgi:hypothetical protein